MKKRILMKKSGNIIITTSIFLGFIALLFSCKKVDYNSIASFQQNVSYKILSDTLYDDSTNTNVDIRNYQNASIYIENNRVNLQFESNSLNIPLTEMNQNQVMFDMFNLRDTYLLGAEFNTIERNDTIYATLLNTPLKYSFVCYRTN